MLVDYRRETAKIEEARLQSIDTQAAGIGTATVAVVVAVSALVGNNHLTEMPFIVGGICALVTLVAAVTARAKHPSPFESAAKLQGGEEDATTRLAEAENHVAAWWSDASPESPHHEVFEAWDAYRDLLKSRADDKETWVVAAVLGLFFTVVAPPLLYGVSTL
jgi:hypothetical protein